MEEHLKRALIEVYYAIAEFDLEKAGLQRNGPQRAEDLETALGTARAALDLSLKLTEHFGVEAPKASA